MNVLQLFFKEHPAISIRQIEAEVECPPNTLRNYLYDYRGFPVKHTIGLVSVLIKYGFQPGGWKLEHDELTSSFTASRPIPDKDQEVRETEDGGFEYYIPHYRTLIGDVHDLIDFLEDAS